MIFNTGSPLKRYLQAGGNEIFVCSKKTGFFFEKSGFSEK